MLVRVAIVLGLGATERAPRAQENPQSSEAARAASRDAAPPGSRPSPDRGTAVTVASEVAFYADTDAVTVLTPSLGASVAAPAAGWSASGRYLTDIVSAASVDIVSTASRRWTELRHAGSLGATYKPRELGMGLDASVSSEPDYRSLSAGGHVTLDLFDKNATPLLAYTFSRDTAGRKDTPFSVLSKELARHAITAGVELVLDPSSTLGLTLDALLERGDQSKPYRMLPMFSPEVVGTIAPGASLADVNRARLDGRMTEHTPGERNRFAFTARFARRFAGSTLVLTDRAYADDWGLLATTTDARFVVDVGRRFLVWAHARGHLQSGASFWRRAYSVVGPTDGVIVPPVYRTGDRELSPLATGTVGGGARWAFGPWARPSAWGLTLQADTMATDFRDAIYVGSRVAELVVLQVEAEL